MADSSLDDFFAKKDKSKKKTKSKITPGDVVPKQESELAGKKGKKKKKDKQATSSSGENDPSSRTEKNEEDEEWVDFEQETEKDYSGLRIQNLQIGKEDGEQEEENKENENEDDEDENGEKREIMSGPWNKSASQPQSQTAPPPTQPKEEEKPPPPAEVPKTPGKYIPPSLRGSTGATPTEPMRPTPLRKKKVAPNLQSEEDFPTLGGGGPGGEMSDMRGGQSFEKVQSGNRNAEDPSKQQSLTLGNKFSALQD